MPLYDKGGFFTVRAKDEETAEKVFYEITGTIHAVRVDGLKYEVTLSADDGPTEEIEGDD